ncbi:uncharacterized protein LOC123612664 isoform X5 [Camelus bactrianus]|uniref:Uncharacterized protein LOC123612664 isoform X5 n=4 Tax=Camelus bactrianus TaxID=9837 RepID=A0AC58Q9W4_CAMBA
MIVAIIPGFALMPRLCHQQVVERSRTPVAEMFDDTHHQIGAASPYPAYDRWLDTQGVCQSPVSTSCPTFLHHWTCQPGLHPGDHVTRGGQREPEPVPIADGTRGLAPAVTRHHGVPGPGVAATICAVPPSRPCRVARVPLPHHHSQTLSDGPWVRPPHRWACWWAAVRRQKRRLASTAFRVCFAHLTSPFALTATVQPLQPDASTLPVSRAGP